MTTNGNPAATINDETSVALEVRLRRLADLHTEGHLDAQEFADAKRLILVSPQPPESAAGPVADGAPRLGRRRWWLVVLIAVVLGFMLSMVSAALTPLQRPAGWAMCSTGRFVPGNVV